VDASPPVMSGSLYFDGSGISVVDDWLDDDREVTGTAKEKHRTLDNKKAQPVAPNPSGKAGLGYAKSKPQPQQDALQARLAKQAEQKHKQTAVDDAEDEGQELDQDIHQHGIVEDYSLSKSNFMNKKETLVPVKSPSKKERKRAREEKLALEREQQQQQQQQDESLSSESASKKGGYWQQVRSEKASFVAVGGAEGGSEKRKRTKTRSKQKNIRKDSRPLHERPNYRPLTTETERKLAMAGP